MQALPQRVKTWLAEAHLGSMEALGLILESCREPLLRMAQHELDDRRLRAKGGASDLVQLTFLEAQQDFEQFEGHSRNELLKWLRHLLRNNVANFRRLYRKAKRRVDREVRLDANHSAGGMMSVSSRESSPSAEAVLNEQTEAVHVALTRLPETYRKVIVMRYQQERSFTEIGRIMGRSVNGAQKLWVRATQRLREELEERR